MEVLEYIFVIIVVGIYIEVKIKNSTILILNDWFKPIATLSSSGQPNVSPFFIWPHSFDQVKNYDGWKTAKGYFQAKYMEKNKVCRKEKWHVWDSRLKCLVSLNELLMPINALK